jgi:hypothetical protein
MMACIFLDKSIQPDVLAHQQFSLQRMHDFTGS